jgi:uncharacterized protein (UPF0212 family)
MNKPEVKVIGKDNNVFVTLTLCQQALKRKNMQSESDEMTKKVFNTESYDHAITIMKNYVTFI